MEIKEFWCISSCIVVSTRLLVLSFRLRSPSQPTPLHTCSVWLTCLYKRKYRWICEPDYSSTINGLFRSFSGRNKTDCVCCAHPPQNGHVVESKLSLVQHQNIQLLTTQSNTHSTWLKVRTHSLSIYAPDTKTLSSLVSIISTFFSLLVGDLSVDSGQPFSQSSTDSNESFQGDHDSMRINTALMNRQFSL